MKLRKADERMRALLRATASEDYAIAWPAYRQLVKALTLPLRQGILKGDITANIFQPIDMPPGTSMEYPLDILVPGTEQNWVAYTIPTQGRIPERHVSGDYLMLQTFEVAGSIDWPLRFARDANWDIVRRCMQILEAEFVLKDNSDAWHALISAGKNRNFMIYDDAATAGLFTKRLVSLMQSNMKRKAGGNTTSLLRGKLTDLYTSVESAEDMRSWDLTQVDDFTRREIWLAGSGDVAETQIFGTTIHDLIELGVSQDFQNYFTNQGGTFPGGKLEMAVGLDLQNTDSFVKPIREEVRIWEDPNFHRQRRAGLYGWGEHGWAVIDSRRVLLGCI